MSLAQAIVEIERLLLQGALAPAERVLQSIRWSAINSLPAQRQQALLWLLQGKKEAALKEFSRLAVHGDTESAAWLATATLYAGQPAIALSGNIFFSQLAIERMRRSRYMDYPLEVTIETLTSCNATCSFCPYPKLDRLGTRMSDELIDKIIGDLEAIPRDLPFGISPFKVNDPLLDKRIFDICAQITRRLPSAQPRLFTNASPMTDAIIERIARIERLQHLWISLNECEPEAYQRVMGLPLERTLQRMDRLHAEVEAGRFPHPVIVSRVRSCTPDDDAFIAFVQQRFPRFAVSVMPYANWAGQIDSPDPMTPPPVGCGRWFELSIMSTGKVALCCMDGEGKHVIGDVTAENALTIYNSESYRKLRQEMPTRLSTDFPCNECLV
jgi:hypothetical protein